MKYYLHTEKSHNIVDDEDRVKFWLDMVQPAIGEANELIDMLDRAGPYDLARLRDLAMTLHGRFDIVMHDAADLITRSRP